MLRGRPRSTRTGTLFHDTPLFRSRVRVRKGWATLPSAASLPAGDSAMVTVGRVNPSVCAAADGASIAAASTARLVVPIRTGMSRLPDFAFRAQLEIGKAACRDRVCKDV